MKETIELQMPFTLKTKRATTWWPCTISHWSVGYTAYHVPRLVQIPTWYVDRKPFSGPCSPGADLGAFRGGFHAPLAEVCSCNASARGVHSMTAAELRQSPDHTEDAPAKKLVDPERVDRLPGNRPACLASRFKPSRHVG